MFKNLISPSVAVLCALFLSCEKLTDNLVQSSVANIDIVSVDGTKQDTIAYYITENIVIGISVLFADSLDSIAFQATDSISGGFSRDEIVSLINIRLPFYRPDTATIIVTGYKSRTIVTSDSAILVITEKEGRNQPPIVQIESIRNYASPALPCTVKVSVTNPEPWQELELMLTPGAEFIDESIFVWIPDSSDAGRSVPIVLTAKDNGLTPQTTSDTVVIAVIADNEVLSEPGNLKVAERTDSLARITWRGDSLADSYILYRREGKEGSIWEEIALSDTSYIDSSDTVYFYRVAAVNFFGVSKSSYMVQGTDTVYYAQRVFFPDTGSTVYESDAIHIVRLGVTAPSTNDITVWYSLKSTGIGSSSALIRAGDTTGVCSLIIVNDTVYQGPRTISVILDSVSGGIIYGIDTHTVSIVDDDTLFMDDDTVFIDDDTVFTVVYDGNGSTGGGVPLDGNGYARGDSVIVLGNNGNLVKSGFSFSGWCATSDPGSPVYTPGTKFAMGAQGVTLYAKWTINTYTITYEGNGNTGGAVPPVQNKTHGIALTLASNTGNLKKAGYAFTGWNTASDGSGTDYSVGASYTLDASITLYAKWTINTYTITYEGNGNTGGAVPPVQTKTHGIALTLSSNTGDLIKTGYTFTGWNTVADGSGTGFAVGASYTLDASITLYAKWTINTYTITYEGNGNTGGTVPSPQTKTHGIALTLASNTGNLVKEGYTFTGWNTAADGSGTDYSIGASYTAETGVTLYAKWTKNTYTVTYDGNGNTDGTIPSPQTKTHGESLILSSNTGNLVKTGFNFVGWNTSSDGNGTDYTEGASYTTDVGVTLYAKWMPLWIVTDYTLADPDGNVYTTVTIGMQVWTVENLKTTRYNDGTAIPLVTDNSDWGDLNRPGYCWYENDEETNMEKYGALYNWYAVNTGKLAPKGWRVPTDEDWYTLQKYLIDNGYNYDGTFTHNRIAKAMAAQTDWRSSANTGAIGNDLTKNNKSGFSALPGGYHDNDGSFYGQSYDGWWWSATEYDASDAWCRRLLSTLHSLNGGNLTKRLGLSVRLIRD